jgi:hypothetical protein
MILLLSRAVWPQEGFPLDGTWRGEWGGEAEQRRQVVMIMQWDGRRIGGTINPGPNSIPFKSAALDPENWAVRIEAETADAGPIVIEGRLQDIGSYHRTIEGTWTEGARAHPLRIARE